MRKKQAHKNLGNTVFPRVPKVYESESIRNATVRDRNEFPCC